MLYICRYQIICELVDRMVDASIHLRQTLGLPAKEFTRASQSDTQMQEEQVVSPGEQVDPLLWSPIRPSLR